MASISYSEARKDEDEGRRGDAIIKLYYVRASTLPSLLLSLSCLSFSLYFLLAFPSKW